MPRELDASVFDNFDHTPYNELVSEGSIDPMFMEVPPTAGAGISQATAEYLADRTAMFQKMTQRKNAPMIYGGTKKDKR